MKNRQIIFGWLLFSVLIAVLSAFLSLPSGKKSDVRTLIVFFSHTGNTWFVAEHIQSLTGAHLFELVPVEPYTEANVFDLARQQRADDILPALEYEIDNLCDYDTIFLGSPNWFGSLSLPVLSLLKSHDLSGKIIIPFITFGRGGLQNTVEDLKDLVPNATILEEFGVGRDGVRDSQPDIEQWLERIGMYEPSK